MMSRYHSPESPTGLPIWSLPSKRQPKGNILTVLEVRWWPFRDIQLVKEKCRASPNLRAGKTDSVSEWQVLRRLAIDQITANLLYK